MKKHIVIFAVLAVLAGGVASAQTLHLVNFCNTLLPEDFGIERDYDRLVSEASLVASLIGYDIDYYIGEGENCSKERLMGALDDLKCGKDDIIIFYYSGHGGRARNDQSEFPQMCLKYSPVDQDKFVAVHTVVEKLQAKNARFTLVLTDCCNSSSSGISVKSLLDDMTGAVELTEAEVARYKKLFLESKGIVVATSSKKGQTSGGGRKGGVFTCALWEYAIPQAINGTIPATWNDVLALTSTAIGSRQQPYWEIRLQPVVAAAPAPVAQPTVTSVDNAFAADLSALLDKTRSVDWRMEQADWLAKRYFSDNAKVATVGRNGTTVIDYESARDFLRRIASSSFVKQVNIIKESTDRQGKRNYIKVQEIRIKK